MRIPLLSLIVILVAAAVGVTWLVKQPVKSSDPLVLVDVDAPPARPVPAPPELAELPDEPVAQAQAQQLVEYDLFRPSRRDPSKTPPPPPPKPPEAVVVVPEEIFELVGIARIGDQACASIAVQSHTVSRAPQAGTPAKTGLPSERKLYRLGDKVGETGYVLQDVGIDYALLGKGAKTLELRIDPDSKSSSERRSASATAAAATAPAAVEAATPAETPANPSAETTPESAPQTTPAQPE
jgi:hypothetical protein